MKFLVEEQGKFKEFLSLHFYQIYPKSEEKGEQISQKNPPYSWDTIFNPPFNFYCIFMHKYFSDSKFWYFFPSKSSILALKVLF